MKKKPSRLISAIKKEPVDQIPIWLMRQAGRYLPEYRVLRSKSRNFLDLCYNVDLATEITMQPVKRFDLDAAIIFSDILIIPFAAGSEVKFLPEKGPVLSKIMSVKDVERLNFHNLSDRLQPVYQIVKQTRKDLSNEKAVIGFCGAPWTIASYMIEGGSSRDFSVIRRFALENPKTLKILFEELERCLANHLVAQIAAGADAVQIFDSWAGVLSDSNFKKLSADPIRRICRTVKQVYPDVPIIVFPRLAGIRYEQFVSSKYIDALSLDQTIPCRWAAKQLQSKIAIQGNLDPIFLLSGGSNMLVEVERICDTFSNQNGFVFNLGHGVIKETPPENVQILCDFIREKFQRINK